MSTDMPHAAMLRLTLATEPGEGMIEIHANLSWLRKRRAAFLGNEFPLEQAIEAAVLDYAIGEMGTPKGTAAFRRRLKARRTQLFFGLYGGKLRYSVVIGKS